MRPALVSVPFANEDRSLIAVVPHTTALRGSQFEIQVTASFLDRSGAFLLQGFATLPPRHFIRRLGILTAQQMALIEEGLRQCQGF